MSVCTSCGQQNAHEARFCSACGRPIGQALAKHREERKVVSVLFADLVGFTTHAELLDPEDVRAVLRPYHERLRTEIERFGGTVEKFIGDAVMALFGAPVAHEDDAERAVRAALAIRDWAVELEGTLQVRIGVNTGEALVVLEARPSEGEATASGDVVNTASRLQVAAPVNGVLVGDATHRATAHVIDYREPGAVTAKGKDQPVHVWEAVSARARFGTDLPRRGGVPLVGREPELAVLTELLARVRRDRDAQLVTISGVPGMGKSRLVAELFRAVEDDPSELMLWRQGRSLPYGEGVTLWALAEIVKAQAGILETDSAEVSQEKLRIASSDLVPEPADAQWIEGHLRSLAGLGGETELGPDRRSEAFIAWRRFFEALAERRPLILVFEDLQWADTNLLDFVEYLVDWVSGVPLLVVGTTRPELFEQRPGWGGGTRNATVLSLSPLSEDDTARLLASLSDHPVLLVERQQALLDRAGGNPLYAEQYVRMLTERGGEADLPMPETIQGIIAARLDALTADEKSLLQDGAVLGKIFWLGALTRIAGMERIDAERALHTLERKEFIRRARRSSVANEVEFSFLHVLVRDVAYGQIPRALRADRHLLAAAWVEALGRTEDHAEMLAHHYTSVLDLRRAMGVALDANTLERACVALTDAGDRAQSLSAGAAAARYYEAALELVPPASLAHGHLVFRLVRVRRGAVDPDLLTDACAELLAGGDQEAAAEAEVLLTELWWHLGERDRAYEHLERARSLIERTGPSRAKADVLSNVSRYFMLAAQPAEALSAGQEALAMAEQLGLTEVRASALINVGCARMDLGDRGGIADLELGAEIAAAANAPIETCRALNNLGAVLWAHGELSRAAVQWDECTQVADRFGQVGFARFERTVTLNPLVRSGRWDDALAGADAFIGEVEAGRPHYQATLCYSLRCEMRFGRGDEEGALADARRAVELGRLAKDPQALYPALAWCAHVHHELGDVDEATVLAEEFLAAIRSRYSIGFAMQSVHALSWTLAALGRGRMLADALAGADSAWARAAVSWATGDHRQAADICASIGAADEEARDRLWLAAELVEQKRRAEAEVQLHSALAFYRAARAQRYIAECTALLAASA